MLPDQSRFHYYTKQISAATPLWGAITPEEHFTIEEEYITTFEIEEYKTSMSITLNPHYTQSINLPPVVGMRVFGNGHFGLSYTATLMDANAHGRTFTSLATMADALNIHNRAYIENGALHLISNQPLTFFNTKPDYDFIGILGLQLYEE